MRLGQCQDEYPDQGRLRDGWWVAAGSHEKSGSHEKLSPAERCAEDAARVSEMRLTSSEEGESKEPALLVRRRRAAHRAAHHCFRVTSAHVAIAADLQL